MIYTKKKIQNFLIVILSLFFIILVLEFFIRYVLKDGPRKELNLDLKNQPISFIEDSELGWKLKPGKYTFKPWSKNGKETKLTNLIDGSRFNGIKDKKEKIIFIGGSLIQGWAVSDNKTFAWQLQEKIKNYNVKNYGVGGYGGIQSFLKLKEVLKKQKNIKLVIYGFIPHHEVRNIASGSWMYLLNKASTGTQGTISLPYGSIKNKQLKINKPKEYLRLPLGNRSALVAKIEKRILKINSLKRSYQQTEISKKVILNMKKISEDNGANFVLLKLNEMPDSKMIVYEDFFKEKLIQNINCYFLEDRKYRVEGEGHPNELAHSIVSDCIYKKINLKNKGLLK